VVAARAIAFLLVGNPSPQIPHAIFWKKAAIRVTTMNAVPAKTQLRWDIKNSMAIPPVSAFS